MADVVNNSTQPQGSVPEKGYVPNKGMSRFVGDTEIKRLRKVLEEKEACIEKFKKYDEERKAYVARLQEEYNDMKEFLDSFQEELKQIGSNEDLSQSDVDQVVKLFGQWYGYKNRSQLYHGKLKSARSCIRDLKEDVRKLEEMMTGIGNIRSATMISDRFIIIRQHLEVLMAKLITE